MMDDQRFLAAARRAQRLAFVVILLVAVMSVAAVRSGGWSATVTIIAVAVALALAGFVVSLVQAIRQRG